MFRHRAHCRVIYGDTDQMGVVYYANYLRWFDMARTEMFRALGVSYGEIEARGIALPVLEAFCKYHSPARYDDRIAVETTLDPAVRAGMKFDYRVFRIEGNAGEAASGTSGADSAEALLAEGYTRHVCLNASGRAVRPPKFLLTAIAAAESASPGPGRDASPRSPASSPGSPPPGESRP